MSKIKVNQSKVTPEAAEKLINICPFSAFEYEKGILSINSACKVCKMCVRKGPEGVCEFVESAKKEIDKSIWQGICVYAEHDQDGIHPVTLELIGKARELADKTNQPVYTVIIGHQIDEQAELLLHYGVDKVFKYSHSELEVYNIENYVSVFAEFINSIKPSSILIGATPLGRSFAPRIAARFQTGLTADCTILDIKENTDLVQIRPAFGGNIMASIITSNNRPQLATVRYKIFNRPEKSDPKGIIVENNCENITFESKITPIKRVKKEKGIDIVEADVIVALGRGVKSKEDLKLVQELVDLLGAEIACTRPLIENGWFDARRQIGLSGRTVAPKLLINIGISGAVQYVAGIKGSEYIVSINSDKNSPIMDVSHLGLIGDVYEVLPALINKIKEDGVVNGL